MKKAGELPKIIYVLEQGPGSGLYAKLFLDYVQDYSQKNNQSFYKRIHYLLADTSQEILNESLANLSIHAARVATVTRLDDYAGKILFVRHSNLWDQLPARLFSSKKNQLSELYVQPVLDQKLGADLKTVNSNVTIEEIAEALKARTIETLIMQEPRIWKPLMQALFLQTRSQLLSEKDIARQPYESILRRLIDVHDGQEFVFNGDVLANITQLLELVDWQASGYIEILDVIVPNVAGFDSPRRPKKFDGALGLPINGVILQVYLAQHNKHVEFQKIRALNHIVTIRQPSLKNLLRSGRFVTIAEIAASKNQATKEITAQAKKLLEQNVDIVAFSDQALVKSEYFKLSELLELDLFRQLPAGVVTPVLKARTKTKTEVIELSKSLKVQAVKNLFVVTGDPSGDTADTHQTSLDILPEVASDFFCGAVAHPQVSDIPRMLAKMKAGAQFFIMQATYDQAEWNEWASEIKKHGIHKKVPIIAVVMPIISSPMVAVVQDIKDVSVPQSFISQFDNLANDEIRDKGLVIAKKMITNYKQSGIFSGIYIYSKSPSIIVELNSFIQNSD